MFNRCKKGGSADKRVYLYKDGVTNTSIVGTWQFKKRYGGESFNQNADHLLLTVPYNGVAAVTTGNDLSSYFAKYKKIGFEYTMIDYQGSVECFAFVNEIKDYTADCQYRKQHSIKSGFVGETIQTIYLIPSDYSKYKYISACISAFQSSGTCKLKITKIWFEE